MKFFVKKRAAAVLLCLVSLAMILAACGGGNTGPGGGGDRGSGGADGMRLNHSMIEAYAYLPEFVDLEGVADRVQGTALHEGRLYFYYTAWPVFPVDFDWGAVDWDTWVDPAPSLAVHSVNLDGSDHQRVELHPTLDSFNNIASFQITPAGGYRMLIIDSSWDGMRSRTSAYFLEFDAQGNEILQTEVEGLVPPSADWFHIDRSLFLSDGSLLLSISGDRGNQLAWLSPEGEVQGSIEDVNWIQAMVEATDGRVFIVMPADQDGTEVRELDFATGAWGESYSITLRNVRDMMLARPGDEFDFLVDDGMHLFGYDIETGERTLILNWIEAGIASDWGYHVSFAEDGRIVVLSSEWSRTGTATGPETELSVLSRVSRADLPERNVITLGSFWLGWEVRHAIVQFNRENMHYQIQVRDYSMYNSPDNWNAGQTRFLAEMAAGMGPDLVFGSTHDVGVLLDRGLLHDLYSFIDADPVLSRSDFFQNVLEAHETADGSLPILGNAFSVQTFVGMAERLGHIDNWTMAEMLALIETAPEGSQPLGRWMIAEEFLSVMIMISGEEFIDWGQGRVNFDSPEFVHLLEIAALLPQERAEQDWSPHTPWISEEEMVLNGDQILMQTGLWSADSIQLQTALFEDARFLGFPTSEGGAHVVLMQNGFGISTQTQHADGAWEFIRQFLLPGAAPDWMLPLRIDAFEEALERAMEPNGWYNEDGEFEESPRMGFGLANGIMIDIYSMSQEEAALTRQIISEASLVFRTDPRVNEMIAAELLPFLAGDRSAADTARILNNRVQILLDELS